MTDKNEHEMHEALDADKSQGQQTDPWTDDNRAASDEKSETVMNAEKSKTDTVTNVVKNTSKLDLNKEGWERELVNRLAFSAINEQRRARRWNIFFKTLFFIYLLAIFALYFPEDRGDIHLGPHTALVELSGPIMDDAAASANNIVGGLRAAFKDKNTRGIILRINSPGGSPVQAGYINDEMIRLQEQYPDIPLYAVVTDMCASAAYYIAAGAKEIYADKASIVGSIGVLMDGFGFEKSMEKLGVERRLLTAGDHKGILDPFSPLKKEDRQFMQGLLNNVHDQFINVVKRGRGDKLANDPKLFSGLFWTGEKSLELGLVDALGSSSYVAREIIGQEKIVDFTPRPNYLDRFAEKIGVAMAKTLSPFFSSQTIMR